MADQWKLNATEPPKEYHEEDHIIQESGYYSLLISGEDYDAHYMKSCMESGQVQLSTIGVHDKRGHNGVTGSTNEEIMALESTAHHAVIIKNVADHWKPYAAMVVPSEERYHEQQPGMQRTRRHRVAVELPEELVGVPKECPRCRSTNVSFRYYNNIKRNQPRYFCWTCHDFFTFGGKVLPKQAVSPGSVDGMSTGKGRKRKAKEPPQFANMEKPCTKCGSKNTAFKYCNNGNSNTPRYKCLDCKVQFQFKRSRHNSSPEDGQMAAADPCTPVPWLPVVELPSFAQSTQETQLDDKVEPVLVEPLETLLGGNVEDSSFHANDWSFLDGASFPAEWRSFIKPEVKLEDPHEKVEDPHGEDNLCNDQLLQLQLDDQSGEGSAECGGDSSPVCRPDEVDLALIDSFIIDQPQPPQEDPRDWSNQLDCMRSIEFPALEDLVDSLDRSEVYISESLFDGIRRVSVSDLGMMEADLFPE